VAVRSDLPRGFLVAQVIHAAGESADLGLPEGTYAIALGATPSQLEDLARRLKAEGVAHRAIIEGDGEHRGELTAVGIAPANVEEVKRFVSSLPLLR
jgi:peptidyl-tRNA hydrolase